MKSSTLLLVIGALGLTATAAAFFGRTDSATDHAQTAYYASGKLQSRTEVDEQGHKTGRQERWYSDGTPQADGHLANGVLQGEWTFWNADGSIDEAKSGTYEDGKRVTR